MPRQAQKNQLLFDYYRKLSPISETKFDGIKSEVAYLQRYYQSLSWFRKLFFPKNLFNSLTAYTNNQSSTNLLTLYETLNNHTSHWFFPNLSVFNSSPLLQTYRKLNELNPETENKAKLFAFLAEQPESLQWLTEKGIRINTQMKLEHNYSKLTLQAITTLSDAAAQNTAATALGKLPTELASQPQFVDAVAKSQHPTFAADMLCIFYNKKQLLTQQDIDECLAFLQEVDLSILYYHLPRLKLNNHSDGQHKDFILYAKYLFNEKTSDLWHAIPVDISSDKLYEQALAICKTPPDASIVNSIITLLLKQDVVFNNSLIQNNPQYDRFTKHTIDRMIAFNDTSYTLEQICTVLPHLIRRNDEFTNNFLFNWLTNNQSTLQNKDQINWNVVLTIAVKSKNLSIANYVKQNKPLTEKPVVHANTFWFEQKKQKNTTKKVDDSNHHALNF